MKRWKEGEILVFDFFPFMAAKYNFDCFLHQDNDGKHTSNICTASLNENNVPWVRNFGHFYLRKSWLFKLISIIKFISPPYSPDLNPIEMVWNEMKNFVKSKFCKTPEEVANAIEEFRLSLTSEKCQNYINRIHKVIKILRPLDSY